jgi:CTP:molybdopterin cytidylyltransferase MocA
VTVAGVILAAGAGSRYGGPKQRVYLPRVLRRVRAAGIEEIVVVAGAYELESDARVVACPDWAQGPGVSLRCGLGTLPTHVSHAIVALADGPDLDPRAISRVVAHRDDADVVAASYGGGRGHPVCLARSVWHRVPDEGGRALDAALVPCDDLQAPGDIDYAPTESPEVSNSDMSDPAMSGSDPDSGRNGHG